MKRFLGSKALALPSVNIVALGLALVAVTAWLWTNLCGFPWSAWNDLRLAPVLMAANGVNPYALPDGGVATTWMYGPVPLWLWWPASLARDAVSAIMAAGVLNLTLTLAAIVFACWCWPVAGASRSARLTAIATCIALWPHATFHFLQADNPAVAFGLIANTALALTARRGRPSTSANWLIALATALALGSKQTAVAMLAAQVIWLWSEQGRFAAVHHLVRTLAVASALAIVACAQFEFAGLWLGAFRIPAELPWTTEIDKRLLHLAPVLLLHIGGPLLLLAFSSARVLRPRHDLRLPFLAWIASLAPGLPAMMTVGGSTNSFHGFLLLLPPLAVAACVFAQHRRGGLVAMAGAVIALVAARWASAPNRPLTPAVIALQQADQICRLYPHQVWFPWNPTVMFFAEGRFYHAEDGLHVRNLTGRPLTLPQFKGGLPADVHFVALRGPDWGLARTFTRGPSSAQHLGYWELWRWQEP